MSLVLIWPFIAALRQALWAVFSFFYVGIVGDNPRFEIFSRGRSNHGGRRRPMAPQSLRWGIKQLANILRDKSVPLKLEKNIIINIFKAILVTTLCERANKHGRSRCPTATMWPQSWHWDTLQSANILQNKFTSLTLENIIVIYTIMTIKVEHMLCQMVKNYTIITSWNVENPAALLEQGFISMLWGSP